MHESPISLLPVIAAIVLAPLIVDRIPRVKVPVVVVEIALGIVIGPHVLGLAHRDVFVEGLAQLGLAFLFFLAGFEIDFGHIRGQPLRAATYGWLLSLTISVLAATVLYATGFIVLVRYAAIAMTSTAIGTLMPILRDAHEAHTPLGRFILAAGALGEFGPIVLTALLLSHENSQKVTLLLLIAFGVLVSISIRLAQRWHPAAIVRLAHQTMNSSAQLPMRLSMLVLIALISVAVMLRLEFLLGAFAAGVIVAQAIKDMEPRQLEPLRIKYEGISFGLLVPIFFVVSGMNFDLAALSSSLRSLLELPMFLVLFLVVRGVPAWWLSRNALPAASRRALALLASTELPLIVAITTLGLQQEQMRPATAAAMVGAGMVSVFVFPLLALAQLRRGPAVSPVPAPAVTS
jgi:Kef-type K+ transport system membrane component KefB